jgi:hypothetical protein
MVVCLIGGRSGDRNAAPLNEIGFNSWAASNGLATTKEASDRAEVYLGFQVAVKPANRTGDCCRLTPYGFHNERKVAESLIED